MSEQDQTEPAAVGAHVVGTERVKRGMAEMLKGGVIMDVVTPEQAKIAEDAGAVAVARRFVGASAPSGPGEPTG